MANELKPCPFCGNEPSLNHMGSGSYSVSCSNGHHINTEASKDKAVKAWNTRPDTNADELEAIVKQAMQDEWEEICADTGCHPLDIEHGRGRRLSFIPLHWASAVSASVRSQAGAIIAAKENKIHDMRFEILNQLDKVATLEADNAALTARVKELEADVSAYILSAEDQDKRRKALETQLAAAKKALEFYSDVSKYPAPFTGGMGALWSDCGAIARAALEGQP